MMRLKCLFLRALHGFTAGATFHLILMMLASYALRLGYVAPCIMSLSEAIGGELKATLLQIGCFSMTGAFIGTVSGLMSFRKV